MELGSVITFSGKSGEHRTLTEEECPGHEFQVIEVGTAQGFHIRCETCLREFVSYGESVLDPITDELATLRDERNAYAGVKVFYCYGHGTANGLTELPAKWFRNVGTAYDVFCGTTQGAVVAAWPHDSDYKLKIVTVQFLQKGTSGWKLNQQREFRFNG